MSAPVATTRSRRGWWGGALGLLAMGAVAAWWFTRGPVVPPPPEPDLSRADAEVASAIRAAIERVNKTPDDGSAWGQLGMVLRAHDFDMDSVAAFRTAEMLDPDDYRWPYLRGATLVLFDPDEGLACLRRGMEKAPPTRPEPRLRFAEALLARGQPDEAARLAADVLASRPDDPRANWVKARAAADAGHWDEALERSAQCKDDPSCRKRAALLRGEGLARRGESSAADAELRTAAAIPGEVRWPDPVVDQVEKLKTGTAARLTRARAMFDQGWTGEAVAELQDAIARAPDDPEPRLMLAQVLNRAGDPTAASEIMTQHTTRFPDSVEGWFQLGVARFQLDDSAAAIVAFQKTVALKPDHTQAHHNVGRCYLKRGDRVAARAAYTRALACHPDHKPTLEALKELDAGK